MPEISTLNLKEITDLIDEDSSVLIQACTELEKVHRALYTELQMRKRDELNEFVKGMVA